MLRKRHVGLDLETRKAWALGRMWQRKPLECSLEARKNGLGGISFSFALSSRCDLGRYCLLFHPV